MITFRENQDSDLVAFENGHSLADLKNPQREALQWAYNLGPLPTEHIVVIGLGSGFHISALADLDPHLQITVIDSRVSLLGIFGSRFPELAERVRVELVESAEDLLHTELFAETVNHRPYVLSFRECWGDQGALFMECFAHLSGRSVESVAYHFEELGLNMKAHLISREGLLSIKDILPIVQNSTLSAEKKQLFQTLGELIKS